MCSMRILAVQLRPLPALSRVRPCRGSAAPVRRIAAAHVAADIDDGVGEERWGGRRFRVQSDVQHGSPCRIVAAASCRCGRVAIAAPSRRVQPDGF